VRERDARERDAHAVSAGPDHRIDVVGLGPAGPEGVTSGVASLLASGAPVYLRTTRHPAAAGLSVAGSFDGAYESEPTFEAVYERVVDTLVSAARRRGRIVYAVPGSPLVAERTVVLLRGHPAVASGAVRVVVHPAMSFLDLVYARLGIDPLAEGVRLVDGERFAVDAAGERGPLVVAQCWSAAVLSGIKLAVDPFPSRPVTVLHHLGLPDEAVTVVPFAELDRTVAPDHLTTVWIPELTDPVGSELLRLDELVRDLRLRCPWDRVQTHGSLAPHLLEECYETLEAIDEVAMVDIRGGHGGRSAAVVDPDVAIGLDDAGEAAVAHLEEELGDLLFQVYLHAALAAEAGWFTLADVARGVHDKLVGRHPHLFGDAPDAPLGPADLSASWEALKKREKGRTSITEGIPPTLPALALAAKLQRKAEAVGLGEAAGLGTGQGDVAGLGAGQGDVAARVREVVARAHEVVVRARDGGDRDGGDRDGGDRDGGDRDGGDAGIGALLESVVAVARACHVDAESALRARSSALRARIEEVG